MLLELNIEQTRHNEIQILGNGEWCIVARRPRLLAADARAEAGRGLGHAGRPARRDRARARRRATPRRRRRSRATSACSSAWRPRPSASAAPSKLDSRVDLRVHRRGRAPLLHGGEHAHPGRAPRVRALLRAALHQPRRPERRLRRPLAGRGDGAHRAAQARACRSRRASGATARRSRRASTPPTARSARPPAASSCRGPTRSRARSATTRASASRTPTRASSCATASPAPTTRTSRCCSPPARPRRELGAAGRDPPPHHAPRHRPRDQPRVPLRHPHLVPGAATRGPSRPRKFVVPYLTLVGELAQEAQAIDLDYAFQQIARRATAAAAPEALEATRQVLDLKETLLERPIRLLFDEPHFLSAWLSQHRRDFDVARRPRRVAAQPGRGARRDLPPARHGRRARRAAAAPHLGPRPRAARHRARLLREARDARPARHRRGRSSTRRCAASAPAFGFDDATLGARPRRARRPPARARDPGAAAADRRQGRLLRPPRSTTT